MQLISFDLPSADLHRVCQELNRLGVAEHVLDIHKSNAFGGAGTTVILKVSDAAAPVLRARVGYSNPANPPLYDLSIDRRWQPFREEERW